MFHKAIRKLTLAAFKVIYPLKINHHGDLPDGQFIITPNHQSYLDGVFVAMALEAKYQPIFVIHSSVKKNPWFKRMVELVDHVEIDTQNPMAMKTIIKMARTTGRSIVIFPEGRLTTTGSLMKIYDGVAFIIAKTGLPILPVYIEGAQRSVMSKTQGLKAKKVLAPVNLHILRTQRIELTQTGSKARRSEAGLAMEKIMQASQLSIYRKKTLFSAFLDVLESGQSSLVCLEDVKQEPMTYKGLLRQIVGIDYWMTRILALPAQTTGVLLPNLNVTLATIFALSRSNRTPALLNYTAGSDALVACIHAAQIKTVITSRVFIEKAKLEGVINSISHLVDIVYIDDIKTSLTLKDKISIVAESLFPRINFAPQHGCDYKDGLNDTNASAVVLFTSGSEGVPKAVVLSHSNILTNIAQIRSVMDVRASDHFFNALPLFHSFGLTGGTLLPLLSGARTFLYPTPLHYKIIPEVVYDKDCTVLLGTNTFLTNYAKHAHVHDFYNIRHVVAGAEKLNDTTRSMWFDKFGIRVMEGYGATEASPVIAMNTSGHYKAQTVGRLLPGMEYRLEPVDGVDPVDGQLLWVKGDNIMRGYYRDSNPGYLDAPALGWYNTGDLVTIDEQGFVSIKGRVKRFVKTAGEMVSLDACEKWIKQALPEHQHACVGFKDDKKGEVVALMTTDDKLTIRRLSALAKDMSVSKLMIPSKVVKADQIPLLGTGKVNYVEVSKRVQSELTKQEIVDAPSDEVIQPAEVLTHEDILVDDEHTRLTFHPVKN